MLILLCAHTATFLRAMERTCRRRISSWPTSRRPQIGRSAKWRWTWTRNRVSHPSSLLRYSVVGADAMFLIRPQRKRIKPSRVCLRLSCLARRAAQQRAASMAMRRLAIRPCTAVAAAAAQGTVRIWPRRARARQRRRICSATTAPRRPRRGPRASARRAAVAALIARASTRASWASVQARRLVMQRHMRADCSAASLPHSNPTRSTRRYTQLTT